MARLKAAVLISGRGTNLRSLIAACSDSAFPAEICMVISNRPGARGLDHAADAGILTRIVDHTAFATRAEFESELSLALQAAKTDLVCCAGFMRVLTDGFVGQWHDRLINIHPSLLPAFPGLDTHARALAAGVPTAGCTVHFIRADVDAGPIIAQAAVPVLPGDNEAALAARVLEAEHALYPFALRLYAEGRLAVTGEVVHIDGAAAPAGIRIDGSAPDA